MRVRIVVVAWLVGSGCRIGDLDVTGLPCPCPEGWRCDLTSNTCTREADVGDGDAASADALPAAFGQATPLPGLVNTQESGEEYPSIDGSGLQLFFGTPRTGGYTLWVALRSRPEDDFGAPSRITELDATGIEFHPEIADDGLELFFNGNMPEFELRSALRNTTMDFWTTFTLMGVPTYRAAPSVSPDGTRLYVAISPTGGIEEYVRGTGSEWQLLHAHPALAGMTSPTVSGDGLEMFLVDLDGRLYRATRRTLDEAFGAPAPVSLGLDDVVLADPELDASGRTLYIAANAGMDWNIYVATR